MSEISWLTKRVLSSSRKTLVYGVKATQDMLKMIAIVLKASNVFWIVLHISSIYFCGTKFELDQENCYPGWSFTWSSSVPTGKCWKISYLPPHS
jgi:hypothetical protein